MSNQYVAIFCELSASDFSAVRRIIAWVKIEQAGFDWWSNSAPTSWKKLLAFGEEKKKLKNDDTIKPISKQTILYRSSLNWKIDSHSRKTSVQIPAASLSQRWKIVCGNDGVEMFASVRTFFVLTRVPSDVKKIQIKYFCPRSTPHGMPGRS